MVAPTRCNGKQPTRALVLLAPRPLEDRHDRGAAVLIRGRRGVLREKLTPMLLHVDSPIGILRFALLRFDAGFAACWWSHIPLPRLRPWLDQFHAVLEPGARVVMLDNAFVQTSKTPIHRRDADGNPYQLRTLDDGSTHEVVKNVPTRKEAVSASSLRAHDATWWQPTHGGEAACPPHYWVLSYTLS